MSTERPVYLSLTQFSFPITAIASILHRITGVFLFLGIAFLLWVLDVALASPEGFVSAGQILDAPLPKLVLWGVLAILTYHIIAGVKHMFLDFHIGDTYEAAARGAWGVFIISAAASVALGVWIW